MTRSFKCDKRLAVSLVDGNLISFIYTRLQPGVAATHKTQGNRLNGFLSLLPFEYIWLKPDVNETYSK